MYYLPHKCGGIAFLYSEKPKSGFIAESQKAFHLDGRNMEYGSIPFCDCCGERINPEESTTGTFKEIKNWNPNA